MGLNVQGGNKRKQVSIDGKKEMKRCEYRYLVWIQIISALAG
jgi:hypothetical protein